MQTTAIIAEYNPFHAGHKYQIERCREEGADYIVVIMSPDYVQRGEPAVLDKYTRTKMALEGGADLVLELPVRFAAGSAQYFAEGAVSHLDALGIIDMLCFGCEHPDLRLMSAAADLTLTEPPAYRAALQASLRQGNSYPKARDAALREMMSADFDFFNMPNNILALEYVRALKKLASPIRPFPIQRVGSGYHDTALTAETYPSASALRTAMDHTIYARYSKYLAYCLYHKQDSLQDYWDVGEDLANRIRQIGVGRLISLEDMTDLLRSRNITQTRIRRALLHVFLELKKEDASASPCYIHLLGLRRSASPLLHELKHRSRIPVITKNAAAEKLLSEQAYRLYAQDLHAGNLYAMLQGRDHFAGSQMTASPIIHD